MTFFNLFLSKTNPLDHTVLQYTLHIRSDLKHIIWQRINFYSIYFLFVPLLSYHIYMYIYQIPTSDNSKVRTVACIFVNGIGYLVLFPIKPINLILTANM